MKKPAPKASRRTAADLRRQIKTMKRALKRLWATYLRWKSEDRKAEQALIQKLRTLQRTLSKRRKTNKKKINAEKKKLKRRPPS